MQRHRILLRAFRGVKQSQKQLFSAQLQGVRWTTAVATDKDVLSDSDALANAKPFEEMPSFYMLPWFGTSWIYLLGRYNTKDRVKASADKRRRLGDIYREKVGPMNLVISFSVDDMQTLLKHEGPYPYRMELSPLKAYRESRKEWYTTTGVLLLQGKEWHDLRTKTQKHLMKPKAVQAYLNPMQNVTRDFVKKILATKDGNNEVPNFLEELYKWALESVALVGLDTRLGCLDLNLAADSDGMRMINAVQTQFECIMKLEPAAGNVPWWKLFPTPAWKRFAKAGDTFTEIAFRYINRSLAELKKKAEKGDQEMTLLQSLLMTKGLEVSGAMVTVADMLMAGIDTTSNTVGFLLYNLARNPDKQERLYDEVTKLLPRKEDKITLQVFNELKYLKACIKESLRIYPVTGGLARIIDHDIVFSGYRVPAGTIAVVNIHAIQMEEKYFTNSKEYKPERWLEKDGNFHPFAYLPFGFGTRSCIGRRLAELEIISLTAEIIRNFKVTYHHEDIGIVTRLINTPDKPLRFNFIER